jgi:hypothetical protein
MATIEEAHQCSGGLCNKTRSDGTLDVLPIYVFSNVNDGVPKSGCHKHIQSLIEDNFSTYKYGFVIALLETSLITFFYMVVIIRRLYKFCCRKKRGKRNKRKEHGQHVSMSSEDVPNVELELEQQDQDSQFTESERSKNGMKNTKY